MKSFKYALKGIFVTVMEERNMKIQMVMAVMVVLLAFFFKVTVIEWITILLSIGFVLVAELVNTAIENLVDGVSPDLVAWAGKVKDIAAGAVLVAAIIASSISLLIFIPYFLPS